MKHKTAENIVNQVIRKERIDEWDKRIGAWTTENNKAIARSLLNICIDHYKTNPSSDNFVLLRSAMRVYQDVIKTHTTASDAITEQFVAIDTGIV